MAGDDGRLAADREGRLLPGDIRRSLADLRVRRPDLELDVRWYPSLPSTMDVVSAAADANAAGGFTAIADEQTAGRGRRGRSWSSPAGAGLYLSYLHRPRVHVELVTLAAGVAVREAVLDATGLASHLKWPNDLLVGSRKLGGLLAEGARIGTSGASITIGVGLNLHAASYPPDVAARATCVAQETTGPVHRGALIAAMLARLSDTFAQLEAGNGSDILHAWSAVSPLSRGARVEWREGAVARSGRTAGVDPAGALLVDTDSGIERIIAGEVSWDLSRD